jgi:alpha,alpha-trehalose phosphorylase
MLIHLLVDDEPFDVRYGQLRAHQRVLDLRAGTLTREAEWVSPAGQAVRVRSVRLVSLPQRAVAAIRYEVEVLDSAAHLVVQSELVANEPLARGMEIQDPRQAAVVEAPLRPEEHLCDGLAAVLLHHTAVSGLRVAAAMDHFVDDPTGPETDCMSGQDLARLTVNTRLEPGQRLSLVKLLAYGWSSQRSAPAPRAQVAPALSAARHTGWDGLLAEQRQSLDDFWQGADTELDGDPELQQAVRFGVFHILQAGARGEDRPIAAKGLTGSGYDGHTFWDTETFVLPTLINLLPSAAASALRWRQSILPAARERARQLGLRGATFPCGPSMGGRARATGRAAPRRSPSMPTSPMRFSGTSMQPATMPSSGRWGWNCWPRRRASGAQWVTMTGRVSFGSTASLVLTSTVPSLTTTFTPT